MKANDLKLFSAIVVAIFLAIPYWRAKLKQSFHKPQNAANEKKEATENA